MLTYAATTAMILCWCAGLTALWAAACYTFVTCWPGPPPRLRWSLGGGCLVPTLAVAPMLLLLAYRLLAVNLLFPVELSADFRELALAAWAPAAVLFATSGLGGTLAREVYRDYQHWLQKPFVRTAMAFGQRPARVLARLVLFKACATAWSQCLPWLYGDLIVVEAVFNAPGLGLDVWHMARSRDHVGLAMTVLALVALYLSTVVLTAWGTSRLGKRLESYG